MEPWVVLYKGGRLPAWGKLPVALRQQYEQAHVDLMLATAWQQGLQRLEGFRLLAPQQDWVRFWIIEFPTLAGAEGWIAAEMAPPYGAFGHYEYLLARPCVTSPYDADALRRLVTQPLPPLLPTAGDPHQIPVLAVDPSTLVVLLFERWRPEALLLTPQERGEEELTALRQTVAQQHGLLRIECFQLLGVQPAWQRVWLAELATLAGAEAWMQAEASPPHNLYAEKTFHLARKWAPAYFAGWVKRRAHGG
jgi:hypothetical protein